MENEHSSNCNVWEWVNSDRTLNNAKRCSCGLRARQEEEQRAAWGRNRPLLPLSPPGITDDDYLRTLGIKPEED